MTTRELKLMGILILVLIAASILNDYLLEDLLFSGNRFSYINKFFAAFEVAFLTFSIRVLFWFKALGLLAKIIFSKNVNLDSPKLRV
jgi:hypothetical protein